MPTWAGIRVRIPAPLWSYILLYLVPQRSWPTVQHRVEKSAFVTGTTREAAGTDEMQMAGNGFHSRYINRNYISITVFLVAICLVTVATVFFLVSRTHEHFISVFWSFSYTGQKQTGMRMNQSYRHRNRSMTNAIPVRTLVVPSGTN